MSSFDRREERLGADELEPAARAAGREADRRARLAEESLHVVPGPGEAADQRLQEKMEEISPDGRPPPEAIKRESRRLFFVGLRPEETGRNFTGRRSSDVAQSGGHRLA